MTQPHSSKPPATPGDQDATRPTPPMAPGDEARAGTPGTGEKVCPTCGGTGRAAGGGDCPACAGTGSVTVGIGGG